MFKAVEAMFVPFIPLLVLALIQGILEFIPVSSEGQLVLIATNIYGIDFATALSIAFWLHLGTAIAVIIFYRRDIFQPIFFRLHSSSSDELNSSEPKKLFGPLFLFVFVGTIGTVIVALPLYFLFEGLITIQTGTAVSLAVGVLLLVTGVILYLQRGAGGTRLLGDIPLQEAFLLGVVQGFAVLPGISRSGMTLTWLLLRGVDRNESLRLSFLLGVPSTFGIIGLDFLRKEFFWTTPAVIAAITLVALVVGIGTLTVLRRTAIRAPFWAFCLTIGIIVIILELPALLH